MRTSIAILVLVLAGTARGEIRSPSNGRLEHIPPTVPVVLVAYSPLFDSPETIRKHGQGMAQKAGSYYAATDAHDTVVFKAGTDTPAADLLWKLNQVKAAGRKIRRLILMGHGREGYSTLLSDRDLPSFSGQGLDDVFIPGAEVLFFSCNVAGFGDGEHGPDDGQKGAAFLRGVAAALLGKNGGRVIAPKGYFYDFVDNDSAKLNPMHTDKIKTFSSDGVIARFVIKDGIVTLSETPAKMFLALYKDSVETEERAWEYRGRGCDVGDPIHVTGAEGIRSVRAAIGRCLTPRSPAVIQRAAERADEAVDEAGYRLSK